jgi:hypothetical protein
MFGVELSVQFNAEADVYRALGIREKLLHAEFVRFRDEDARFTNTT